jgi:hypothetical protein
VFVRAFRDEINPLFVCFLETHAPSPQKTQEHFALVVANQQRYRDGGNVSNNVVVCGVVSRIDLLRFIADGQSTRPSSVKSIPPTPQDSK